ncbi:energy transducer TonB [Sphingosinithalassobacter portus]|uniref:energy transducer TonB n=1 Tax=Stakelama portus TaxID=2676234 RepID=UPI000D6EA2CC|nr:energy transducer TonB [Sphingosinithalassobacter portus]
MTVWQTHRPAHRARIAGALIAGAVGAALLAMIWLGLAVRISLPVTDSLALFEVQPPAPPPPEQATPVRKPSTAREGEAAPPALRARPRPVVAPTPRVQPLPPPRTAPPVAAEGSEDSAGASDRPGPGTGAAGVGAGLGSGGSGTGTGSGIAVAARRVRGAISPRDYPRQASRDGITGSVTVHLDVDARGRVTACSVARSSGSALLDSTTCRLAVARFRYQPARDAQGQPVPTIAGYRQDWWLEPR